LTDASYVAQDPGGNMSDPQAQEHFHYDELGNRFGSNQTVSYGMRDFTRQDNGLNQYKSWGPVDVPWLTSYDDDLGGGWGSAGHANGVLMQDGNVTAGYNALNQPMFIQRTIYNGTSNCVQFGHDPLGRCVKRWAGPGHNKVEGCCKRDWQCDQR
jgi:hypothetical protein